MPGQDDALTFRRMSAEPEKAHLDVSSDVDMEKPKSNKKAAAKGGKAGKSKEALDSQKFEFGDIVLARLRGFPPWREFPSRRGKVN